MYKILISGIAGAVYSIYIMYSLNHYNATTYNNATFISCYIATTYTTLHNTYYRNLTRKGAETRRLNGKQ